MNITTLENYLKNQSIFVGNFPIVLKKRILTSEEQIYYDLLESNQSNCQNSVKIVQDYAKIIQAPDINQPFLEVY